MNTQLTRRFSLMTLSLLLALVVHVAQGEEPDANANTSEASSAEPNANASGKTGVQFDLEALSKPPAMFETDLCPAEGVRAFFYEGLNYQGKPTRIFTYYSAPPEAATQPGKKFPAMVLIHGGGGTAFASWVKLWNSRGYAAISMDLCGSLPNQERHEHGGPPGWDPCMDHMSDPIEDQWPWHAVSGIVLANSLLRSFPEVDPDRIGMTGISWGGYLTCVTAGVDSRFNCAIPVYGCGFLGVNSHWLYIFDRLGPEKTNQWMQTWDPAAYLANAKMPMLWVNGTNDFAYPMDSWQKSYRLPTGPRTLCLRIRMPHGHGGSGENPAEIHVFAESIFNQGKPLAKITDTGHSAEEAWATYEAEEPLTKAELSYTLDSGKWQERKWEAAPAEIDTANHKVTAKIPQGATVCYLNLFDNRDCAVSSEHFER